MNYGNIEKASKMLETLKEFDAETIKLEKMAERLANNSMSVKMSISWDNPEEKKEVGSAALEIINRRQRLFESMFVHTLHMSSEDNKKSKCENEMNFEFNEMEMLVILDSMIELRRKQREYLTNQIENLIS